MQCGYCIPGFIMTSVALLNRDASPTARQIREALAQNMCRCGTYQRIQRAVENAAAPWRRRKMTADRASSRGPQHQRRGGDRLPAATQHLRARRLQQHRSPTASNSDAGCTSPGRLASSSTRQGRVRPGHPQRPRNRSRRRAARAPRALSMSCSATRTCVPWDMGTFGSQSTARVGRAAAQGRRHRARGAARARRRPPRPAGERARGLRGAPSPRSTTPPGASPTASSSPAQESRATSTTRSPSRRGRLHASWAGPSTRIDAVDARHRPREVLAGHRRRRHALRRGCSAAVAGRTAASGRQLRRRAHARRRRGRPRREPASPCSLNGRARRSLRRCASAPQWDEPASQPSRSTCRSLVGSRQRARRHAGRRRRSKTASRQAERRPRSHVLRALHLERADGAARRGRRVGRRSPHRLGRHAAALRHPHGAGAALRHREAQVRVIAPEIGGGFGSKSPYPVAHGGRAARAHRRPARARGLHSRRRDGLRHHAARGRHPASRAASRRTARIVAWEFDAYHAGDRPFLGRRGSEYAIRHAETRKSRRTHATARSRPAHIARSARAANHFAREVHIDEIADAVGARPGRVPPAQSLAPAIPPRAGAGGGGARLAAGVGAVAQAARASRSASTSAATSPPCVAARCPAAREVKVDARRPALDCGLVVNPEGAKNQVEGAIVMGMGTALYEAIDFEDGRVLNAGFTRYRVPRMHRRPSHRRRCSSATTTRRRPAPASPASCPSPPRSRTPSSTRPASRIRELPLQRQLP